MSRLVERLSHSQCPLSVKNVMAILSQTSSKGASTVE
jgi:hypothetical protein